MIKKSKKAKGKSLPEELRIPVQDMTYKDLRRAVVVRGMPFEQVVAGDFFKLNSWLHNNYSNDVELDLLDEYDEWMENELISIGSGNMIHPSLRLGYIGEKDTEENTIKLKKIKVEKKPKEKREKTEEGLFKGTKKALTFQCANDGLSLEDTITKVMEQFDDASDKSIKIWYKKAKRNAKNSL